MNARFCSSSGYTLPYWLRTYSGDIAQLVFVYSQLHGKAHSAADQAAKDVALVDVRRRDGALVAHHKRGAADMVGDYSERARRLGVVLIIFAGKLGNLCEYANKYVRIVNRFNAL